MRTIPAASVLDASTGIKILLREPLSEQARRIFAPDALGRPARLHVPDLFLVECANVLWKAVHRLRLTPELALKNTQDLLCLDLVIVPSRQILAEAARVALSHDISVYDACYAATALLLRLPLITADERLAARLAKGPCDVIWLGDIASA